MHEDLGVCGWYPFGIFVVSHILGITKSFMFLGNAMMWYTPKFRCRDGLSNETLEDTAKLFAENASTHADTCASNCSSWVYSVPRTHTFVAEWDIVCDRAPLKYLTEAFFFMGSIAACTFMGYLSDRFGRRIVMLGASIFAGIVGCQAIWVPNLYAYLAVRFFLGMANVGTFTDVYKSEIFSAKWRFMALNLDLSFIYGSMLTPLISYLIPNWRHFCVAVSNVNFLAALLILLMPESPLWLIRMKRFQEAYAILKRAAERRGQELDFDRFMEIAADAEDDDDDENGNVEKKQALLGASKTEEEKERSSEESGKSASSASLEDSESFRAALRSNVYVLVLVASAATWAYNESVYVGITLSYGTLSGDRLINFFLNQFVSLPSTLVGIALSQLQTRRAVLIPWYGVQGLLFLVVLVSRAFYDDVDAEIPLLRRVVNIAVLFAVWVSWASTLCFLQEVFPTLLRSRSNLIACFCARVVSGTASFFPHLQENYPVMLETVFGVSGVALGVFLFFIPETFKKPLPQTIAELEAMSQGRLCGGTKDAKEEPEEEDKAETKAV